MEEFELAFTDEITLIEYYEVGIFELVEGDVGMTREE